MASLSVRPKLEKLYFLREVDERFVDPDPVWKQCQKLLNMWESEFCRDEKIAGRMVEFCKQKAINMIWLSNKLGGTLPEGVSEMETHQILTKLYDGSNVDELLRNCAIDTNDQDSDAERDRNSKRQLLQHLQAFLELRVAARDKRDLSEDLILGIHKTLMKDLALEGGGTLHGGEYRQISVHAGAHVFPSHQSVPASMKRDIKEYNEKAADPNHDPYHLASWILHRVITIHPFEDGNGRLCRLLWCFSLMRDGLPFPLTISSGASSAHKHYVRCIENDRRRSTLACGHLTTLTVVSVESAWNNFVGNLEFELPDICEGIYQKLKDLYLVD